MDEKNQARPDARDKAARPSAPQIIEGPSATTDPENSRSGNAAYVIFGVGVAVLVLLALSLSSCATSLAQFGLSRVDWDSPSYQIDLGDPTDELPFGLDGLGGGAGDLTDGLPQQDLTRA